MKLDALSCDILMKIIEFIINEIKVNAYNNYAMDYMIQDLIQFAKISKKNYDLVYNNFELERCIEYIETLYCVEDHCCKEDSLIRSKCRYKSNYYRKSEKWKISNLYSDISIICIKTKLPKPNYLINFFGKFTRTLPPKLHNNNYMFAVCDLSIVIGGMYVYDERIINESFIPSYTKKIKKIKLDEPTLPFDDERTWGDPIYYNQEYVENLQINICHKT
jgi:hypothetical protein